MMIMGTTFVLLLGEKVECDILAHTLLNVVCSSHIKLSLYKYIADWHENKNGKADRRPWSLKFTTLWYPRPKYTGDMSISV